MSVACLDESGTGVSRRAYLQGFELRPGEVGVPGSEGTTGVSRRA